MKYRLMSIVVAAVFLTILGAPLFVEAATESRSVINCGLTVKAPKDSKGAVVITKMDDSLVDGFISYDEKLTRLSSICRFELTDTLVYTSRVPLSVKVFHEKTNQRPHIFLLDEQNMKWKMLETEINRVDSSAVAELSQSNGIVGVFADISDTYEGTGSWYAHARYPSGSATNLFPLGTELTVTNLDNKKTTNVTVTSTWTQKDSKRVIDLVSTAFKKIASLREGLIHVKIERRILATK